MLDHRKGLKRGLIAGAATVAALASAAPAMAAPTGAFADFKYCPFGNTAVTQCLISDTTSGAIKLGNQNVPINKLIRLQGGLAQNQTTFETTFVNANPSSQTLVAPELDVPGGLLGMTPPNLFPFPLNLAVQKAIDFSNTVTAKAELVGTPTVNTDNLINTDGTAVTLPLRIKLSNPFLGDNCYIGSSSSPVTLRLTSGTTRPPAGVAPITGNAGNFASANGITTLTGVSLVENTFTAPGATNCGPLNGVVTSVLVNPIVNLKVGLPAASGKSSARLNGNVRLASAAAVRASNR